MVPCSLQSRNNITLFCTHADQSIDRLISSISKEIKIELYGLSAEDNEQPVPECDGEAWLVCVVGRKVYRKVLYEHREQVLIMLSSTFSP